ncbi:MAG: LVIVD repeat-containing protein, partial [Planctomycetota bacterium]
TGNEVKLVDITNRHVLGSGGATPAGMRTPFDTVGVALPAGTANALGHTSADLSDPFVVVASGSGGLTIVDASDYFSTNPPGTDALSLNTPAAPTAERIEYDITGPNADARDVDLRGTLAFIADGDNVSIVDIEAKARLGFAAVDKTGSGTAAAVNLQVRDRFIYVACGTGGVQVFDWAHPTTLALDPSEIRHVGTFRGTGGNLDDARALRIYGSFLVVAGGNNGVHILDITKAQAPEFHTSARFGGTGTIKTVTDRAGNSVTIGTAVSIDAGSVPLVD